MRKKKDEEKGKNHSIRCSDEDWKYFIKLKPADKSWSLFIQELTEIIKYFKKL